ncbi:YncE family protein [Micromonospora sp. NPDC050397]|uniref:YncE family protein n=1 Tax=Micromonospora sp. NPDC050397 TaxID=3364279 RepID=UPI0038516638
MTTRRTVLRLAGGIAAGAAGGGMVVASGGCRRGTDGSTRDVVPANEALVVELAAGELAVLDAVTGQTVVNRSAAVVSGDGSRLVRSELTGGGTRITNHRISDGSALSSGLLTDQLTARATSPDGELVALATLGEPGTSPYRPGGRERTTIVVAGSAGQQHRVELPGNLEPEAFDVTGQALFVLDYLPPTAPDRYRVRVVDLVAGELQPLVTRVKSAVPPGAEEEMRGEGRQAVYDSVTRQLFTLYTHQPDHEHTRDLIAGAREDAPHVHAFVHTLNLTERWAFCVDLPAPFGEGPAAAHAIALDPNGGAVYVVDATSGTIATIDPSGLTVKGTVRFTPPAGPVTSAAATTGSTGVLLVGAGRDLVTVPLTGAEPTRRTMPTAVRGIAASPDRRRCFVGQDDGVLRVDLGTGVTTGPVAVPGLQTLRQVVARS